MDGVSNFLVALGETGGFNPGLGDLGATVGLGDSSCCLGDTCGEWDRTSGCLGDRLGDLALGAGCGGWAGAWLCSCGWTLGAGIGSSAGLTVAGAGSSGVLGEERGEDWRGDSFVFTPTAGSDCLLANNGFSGTSSEARQW